MAALFFAVSIGVASRSGGALELVWGADTDKSMISQAASSLQRTIATAEGSPSPWTSPVDGVGPTDDVALGDVGGSLAKAPIPHRVSDGEKAIAEAQAQLRLAQRLAVRKAQIKLAEAEKAKLEKRVQKERVEYTRVALKERAREGEEEAKRLRKKLRRREAHLERVARERRRQREARKEVERAKRWTQHQKVSSKRTHHCFHASQQSLLILKLAYDAGRRLFGNCSRASWTCTQIVSRLVVHDRAKPRRLLISRHQHWPLR